MSNENKRWVFPTVKTTQNKGIERIALSGQQVAHELTGIDGSLRFGIRPSSGMKLAHELNTTAAVLSPSEANGGVGGTDHTNRSVVTDCFPVQMHISEGEFLHGFVYRIKDHTGGNVAIYMDYCPTTNIADFPYHGSNDQSEAGGWRTVRIASGAQVDLSSMDVVSMGQFVGVFVRGKKPLFAYIDTGDPDLNIPKKLKIVEGGPGSQPTLLTPDDPGHASSTIDARDPGSISVSSGEGKIVLTNASTHEVDRTDDSTDNPLFLNVLPDREYQKLEPGNYSFAYYLHDSKSGRRTALSEVKGVREEDFTSSAAKYAKLFFRADTNKYDQIYIFRSVRTQEVGGIYAASILHLDNIYELSGTDSLLESNDIDHASVNMKSFVCLYELPDMALAMQDIYLDKVIYDAEVPQGKSAVPFEGALLVADPKGGTQVLSNQEDRIRNVGELRWSSLTERSPELFPINNKYTPDIYQNRIEKLVRVGEFAVGFSKDRIYHIRRNGLFLQIEDMHAGFGLAGQDAAATAGPLAYFVTTKGLKAVANNGQLDDVEFLDNLLMEDWKSNLESLQMEFDPYASCMFILNPATEEVACLWFNVGRVSEFHDMPFDKVKKGVWPRTWSVKDPVPTADTSMVERAFFLQNHPSTTATDIPANWKPRVYLLDVDRSKNAGTNPTQVANNSATIRTLDFAGDTHFKCLSLAGTSPSGQTIINLDASRGSPLPPDYLDAGTNGVDLVGAYAYVLESPGAPESVGSKIKIYYATSPGTSLKKLYVRSSDLVSKLSASTTAIAGTILGLSPMYVHWVGATLPMVRVQDGKTITSYDMFNNKQISSIGCHFTDVSGGVTGYKFFRGEAWNSTATSASVQAIPSDFAGVQIGDSVQNGESNHYAAFKGTDANVGGKFGIQDSVLNPGIEIFAPDLDFKLMAVICRGRATSTDMSERPT
jgi:hypothetical protein